VGEAEYRAIYRKRGQVAEFPNAWIKEKLGLRKFRTRFGEGRKRTVVGLPDVQHHAVGAADLAAAGNGMNQRRRAENGCGR